MTSEFSMCCLSNSVAFRLDINKPNMTDNWSRRWNRARSTPWPLSWVAPASQVSPLHRQVGQGKTFGIRRTKPGCKKHGSIAQSLTWCTPKDSKWLHLMGKLYSPMMNHVATLCALMLLPQQTNLACQQKWSNLRVSDGHPIVDNRTHSWQRNSLSPDEDCRAVPGLHQRLRQHLPASCKWQPTRTSLVSCVRCRPTDMFCAYPN